MTRPHPRTTENKALEGTGGIIGVTPWDQALVRWFLACPITAAYAAEFKKCTNTDNSQHDQSLQAKARIDM